ncbi:MAG: hypothetical protein ACMG6H_06100, partial [Acidobacteriota bacterium]
MSEQNNLEENKALIRRWFEEVWNKGRTDAIPEMMAEHAVAHGLSGDAAKPLRGPSGFLPFHAQVPRAVSPTSCKRKSPPQRGHCATLNFISIRPRIHHFPPK